MLGESVLLHHVYHCRRGLSASVSDRMSGRGGARPGPMTRTTSRRPTQQRGVPAERYLVAHIGADPAPLPGTRVSTMQPGHPPDTLGPVPGLVTHPASPQTTLGGHQPRQRLDREASACESLFAWSRRRRALIVEGGQCRVEPSRHGPGHDAGIAPPHSPVQVTIHSLRRGPGP